MKILKKDKITVGDSSSGKVERKVYLFKIDIGCRRSVCSSNLSIDCMVCILSKRHSPSSEMGVNIFFKFVHDGNACIHLGLYSHSDK